MTGACNNPQFLEKNPWLLEEKGGWPCQCLLCLHGDEPGESPRDVETGR